MIKVIDIDLYNGSWVECNINNAPNTTFWESPVINNFLNNGWSIKDWKITDKDCIFIFEKPD